MRTFITLTERREWNLSLFKEKKFTELYVFDLDGTLVHGNSRGKREISSALVEALQKLSLQAHIAIATGRRYRTALPDLDCLPFVDYRIVHNGLVIKRRSGETVFSAELDKSMALEVAKLIEAEGFHPAFVSDGHVHEIDYCFTRRALEVSEGAKVLKNRPFQHSHILESLDEVMSKLEIPILEVALLGQLDELLKLRAKIEKRLPAELRPVIVKNVGHTAISAMEIFSTKLSKASGMSWVKTALNALRVTAVGDDGNDIEMVAEADYGVAMSHADEELKSKAKRIVEGPEGLLSFLNECLE